METDIRVETQQKTLDMPQDSSSDGPHAVQGQAEPTFSFVAQTDAYKASLDQAFDESKNVVHALPPKDEMPTLDWDELEARYQEDIAQNRAQERDITDEFERRFQQFLLWTHVSSEREVERSLKRLRTQKALVQMSEHDLVHKQQHYDKVLQAFQSAMALLAAPL